MLPSLLERDLHPARLRQLSARKRSTPSDKIRLASLRYTPRGSVESRHVNLWIAGARYSESLKLQHKLWCDYYLVQACTQFEFYAKRSVEFDAKGSGRSEEIVKNFGD